MAMSSQAAPGGQAIRNGHYISPGLAPHLEQLQIWDTSDQQLQILISFDNELAGRLQPMLDPGYSPG